MERQTQCRLNWSHNCLFNRAAPGQEAAGEQQAPTERLKMLYVSLGPEGLSMVYQKTFSNALRRSVKIIG